jgi:hypothetical protein
MEPYELFEVLASKTWRSIERFSRRQIHLGEDAITSHNLDSLESAEPQCTFVEDTRVDESSCGSKGIGHTRRQNLMSRRVECRSFVFQRRIASL